MGETLSGAHARESIAGDSAAVSSQMLENAKVTTAFLKSLSHPVRLVILCRLAEGKTSVGELETLVGVPQAVRACVSGGIVAAYLSDSHTPEQQPGQHSNYRNNH